MRKTNNIGHNVRGKFFTIEHASRGKSQKMCAKFVGESNHYIRVTNVNTGETVKLNKDNIVSLSCGSFRV